jgi:hypothetical protein
VDVLIAANPSTYEHGSGIDGNIHLSAILETVELLDFCASFITDGAGAERN